MHLNGRRGLVRCLVGLVVVGAGYAGLSWMPAGQANSVWTNLGNSLLGLTIPPLAILTVAWMASGFRARATEPLPERAVVVGPQADVSEIEIGIEPDGPAAASPVLAQNVSRRRGHGRSFGHGRPLNAPAETGDLPTADDFRAVYSIAEWPEWPVPAEDIVGQPPSRRVARPALLLCAQSGHPSRSRAPLFLLSP